MPVIFAKFLWLLSVLLLCCCCCLDRLIWLFQLFFQRIDALALPPFDSPVPSLRSVLRSKTSMRRERGSFDPHLVLRYSSRPRGRGWAFLCTQITYSRLSLCLLLSHSYSIMAGRRIVCRGKRPGDNEIDSYSPNCLSASTKCPTDRRSLRRLMLAPSFSSSSN